MPFLDSLRNGGIEQLPKLIFYSAVQFIGTTNFSQNENFVVLECVCRLLEKGYKPHDMELEPLWKLGHSGKSGRADITVYDKDADGKPNHPYLIIECKCAGREYKAARKDMFENPDGKQLFSYWAQARSVKWLELYASDYDEGSGEITFQEELIRSCDDDNVEALAKEDASVLIFKNASTAEDAFMVWEETYSKKVYNNNIIFGDDAAAYKIGNTPLTNRKLKKFTKDDSITDRFREILRHNSISDKENAFNQQPRRKASGYVVLIRWLQSALIPFVTTQSVGVLNPPHE